MMIKFSEFLLEARMAPLYHTTSTLNLIRILNDNTIKGNKQFYDPNVGVSFTRSLKFAKLYGERYIDEPVIIEVDQLKLSHRYKMIPFNYWPELGTRKQHRESIYNEFEERVIGDIKDADRYITKIIVLEKPGRKIKGNIILNHPKLYYDGKFVNK